MLHPATDVPVIGHWINGQHVTGSSTRTGDVYDPALGTVTKKVTLADDHDVAAAVASAQAAFAAWSQLSLAKRQSVLFKFRELLEAGKMQLAESSPASTGKCSPTPSARSHAAKRWWSSRPG